MHPDKGITPVLLSSLKTSHFVMGAVNNSLMPFSERELSKYAPLVIHDDDGNSDDASQTSPCTDRRRKRCGTRRHQTSDSPDPNKVSGEETTAKAVGNVKVRTYSYMSPINSDSEEIPQSTCRRGCAKQVGKRTRDPPPNSRSGEGEEEPKRERKGRQRRWTLGLDGRQSEPKSGISTVARKARGRPKQDLPVSLRLETRTGAQQNNGKWTNGCDVPELIAETENDEVSGKPANQQKAVTSGTSWGKRSTNPASAESSEPSLFDVGNIAKSHRNGSPVQTSESMSDESRSGDRSEGTDADAKDTGGEIELDTEKVRAGNASRKVHNGSSASSSTDEGDKKQASKRHIRRRQERRRRESAESSCDPERPGPRSRARRAEEGTGRHGRGPIECEVCGRSLRCRAIMERHMLTHTGEKPFECSDCGRCYTSGSNLRIHQLSHSGAMDFACNECGQKFTHLPYLNRHLLRHAGKKLHICDQCGKGFIQKYHLERHLLLHTGKTPYACEECGATFTRTDYLKMHMRNAHVTRGGRVSVSAEPATPRSHKCKTCEKTFASHSVLETHMRVHTGVTPFACIICQRQFKQSSQMMSHMRTHTGEKPHTCDVCGLRFTRRSYIRVHKRKAHDASDQVPSSC